jgi:hypothetical protein
MSNTIVVANPDTIFMSSKDHRSHDVRLDSLFVASSKILCHSEILCDKYSFLPKFSDYQFIGLHLLKTRVHRNCSCPLRRSSLIAVSMTQNVLNASQTIICILPNYNNNVLTIALAHASPTLKPKKNLKLHP